MADKKSLFVPVDINSRKYLPKIADREYTKLEALFSVQLDHFKNNPVSISGYSKLWKWSRNKVSKFLDDIGAQIEYDFSTTKKQNQKGQIGLQIRDRSRTDKGQISFIDLKCLDDEKDRSRTDKGQIRDRSGSTTNKRKKEKGNTYSNEFEKCWQIYPMRNGVRQGKKQASDHFEKLSLHDKRKVYASISNYIYYLSTVDHGPKDMERFIKHRVFDDYQNKPQISKNKSTDGGREEAQKRIEETNKILNG